MRGTNTLRFSVGCAVALGLALGACGDDKGGGGGTDTSQQGDVIGGTDTTQPGADTTQPGADTTQPGTDTTQPPTDTAQPPPARMCTDAELQTFDACVAACTTPQCQQGCLSGLSGPCQTAYTALASCSQANSCGEDLTCIATNCPDEVAAVFGTGPAPSDCDPVTNAGCEANQNCTLVTQTELGCAPAGTAGYGQNCSQTGCARGACLTFDNTNFECLQFCDPDDNQCREDRPCNIAAQGTDFTFCGNQPTGCDLFAQDCPAPQGCYLVDQQGGTDCAPHANKQSGAACSFVNDCAPGLICAGAPGSAACAPLCNTDGTTPCASGTCTGIGIGTIGACI